MHARANQRFLFLALFVVGSASADPACSKLKPGYTYDLLAPPKMGCSPQVKECPDSVPGREIKFDFPKLPSMKENIDHTKSLDEIKGMTSSKYLFSARSRNKRGKTVTALFNKVKIEVEVKKSAGDGNGFCGAITSISISETRTIIYIPKQFKTDTADSCPYDTTFLHESKHYHDAKAALDQMYDHIDGAILRELDSGTRIPFAAASATEAQQILSDAVNSLIAEQRDWLKYKLQQDVDDFDTPERSEYEDTKCRTWPD